MSSSSSSSSSGLYSFLGTAAAIATAVAAKQLLKREPIGRHQRRGGLPTATLASPHDTLSVHETDAKRVARETDQKSAKEPEPTETLHYAVGPDGARPIKYAKSGIAAEPAVTVIDALRRAVKNQPEGVALKQERGGEGKWVEWTWTQYERDVMQCARAFLALGLERFQAVNILGFNSPEWFVADLAAIACGGKAAGIYPTNSPSACHYITAHSEALVVVVENELQLKKYLTAPRDALPRLKALVLVNGPVPAGVNGDGKVPVLSWDELMALGAPGGAAQQTLQTALDARLAALRPEQCSTLIYTSGTTGHPKAVMISHDNAVWTARVIAAIKEQWRSVADGGEHLVSYLPLSHIAAQMLDLHVPLAVTGHHGTNCTVWFARPDALKSSLAVTLRAARPTMFLGVPRVWEKIEEKMRDVGAGTTGLKKKIADWAKAVGAEGFANAQVGGKDEHLPRFHWVAQKLVFANVKKALGLDRCDLFYSGAAPIAPDTVRYFGQLNIPVWEVYGMSECSGPQCIGTRQLFKVGAVGAALPGTELKLEHVQGRDRPGEGEVLYRGRHIMMGYMKDAAKTRDAIDAEGFLHSGDVGRLDAHGLLYITGRIKELLIGAGGENIAPVPVEDGIKAQMPALANVMMVGDRRKFSTALFTLKTTVDDATGAPTNVLAGAAAKVSDDSKTVDQALTDPKWKAYLDAGLARANKLATSNAQTVQKYTVLPTDFSVAGGELTATLKLKRAVVAEKYAAVIEAMYA